MSKNELEVVNAMCARGGSFVRALGNAFIHADSVNFEKLKSAFPDYWMQYETIVRAINATPESPKFQ